MPPIDDSFDLEPPDRSTGPDAQFDGGAPDRWVPFGKYLLMGRIARGGMAEIYRARSASGSPAKLLAIKCMRSNLAGESRFVEMFIREGKLAMMLEHGGIVRTYDVGAVDGRYFISMDYLAGKDLNTVLRRCQELGRRIPVPHAIYIASRVCRALDYAHNLRNARGDDLNIVNRDVSPSNIRISYEGDVKLLDFGIAQALLQVSSEIGILKGKFSYMSPEQVRGLPLDRRTDIFSMGIVLHEMLACERLFRDESEFVLMEKVRRVEVKPPSTFNKRVPPELDSLVMKALSREAASRYQEADLMARDLEQLLEGYQFASFELGELVRGLYPKDYRRDQEIEEICLASAPVRRSIPDATEQLDEPPSVPQEKKRQRQTTRRADKSNRLLWVAAVALLFVGLVLLVIALI